MINPRLCDVCGEVATYGDGVTWAKCSQHQYEVRKDEVIEVEAQPEKPLPHEGFEHRTETGLTSIIIPIYNVSWSLFHFTGHCVGSIRYFTKDPYEIIIVDNGSPCAPASFADYKVNKVIHNDTNLGYVKAVNQGIRASFGEYIAVVCNDVEVYEGWLEDAKEALKYLDVVIATPMYGEPFSRALEAQKKREEWLSKPIEESFSDFRDGSAFVTTKKLLDEVGLLDERFFNYTADSDFYRRVEQANGRVASSKRINTFHITSATAYGIDETPEIMNEDKAKFHEKWDGVQEEPKVEEVKQESEVPSTLIRSNMTGDKVFLLRDGKRHWITSIDVLQALGLTLGNEETLEKEDLLKIENGEAITMNNVSNFK